MKTKLRPSSRDAIIESAFIILSQNPGAPLSDIAQQAGVGRATLHRHFASRQALILALTHIAIEEMDAASEVAAATATSHLDALRKVLCALIPLGDRHGFLAQEPVTDDPNIAAAFDRQQTETEVLIEAAKTEGDIDPSVPTVWVRQAFDYLLYAAWDSVKADEVTHKQAAALAWRTLVAGLGSKQS